MHYYLFFFFFKAEDGIRDDLVTGVQTCTLPIWSRSATPLMSLTPTVPARIPLSIMVDSVARPPLPEILEARTSSPGMIVRRATRSSPGPAISSILENAPSGTDSGG